ncbi:MAG: glycoside hydrolase family 9 protein, partial [Fimbriimonadaceae bacterium]|nr:glycoside hydrolase family 9 protein [Fimbriimonadaceae bacterium]
WNVDRGDDPGEVQIRVGNRLVQVQEVGRKSFPGELGRIGPWEFDGEQVHRLYLRTAAPLPLDQEVSIWVQGLPTVRGRLGDPARRVEGLRINQLGFRPDDPDKSALFSLWMGSLGPARLESPTFDVVDEQGGLVFSGPITEHHDGVRSDSENYDDPGAGAPVFLLDFTRLEKPGRYRIRLAGIGLSEPFTIGENPWREAFAVGAKGFFYQRNAQEFGPPFSRYRAPASFPPNDPAIRIRHSTTMLMDSGNGLNAQGTDTGNFENLVKGATDEHVPEAWGGYKDAGDWDTRVQHLLASRNLVRLSLRFPAADEVRLNIPGSGQGVPDILVEAAWAIDHHRRMQNAEGGVRGGYEMNEHPLSGETSWQNSLQIFAYAPDPWSSRLYAASAGLLALRLQSIDPIRAAGYRDSALRAYDWADRTMEGLTRLERAHGIRDSRVLAAVVLHALTGQERFVEAVRRDALFLGESPKIREWQVVDQTEAAEIALQLKTLPDDILAAARREVVKQADSALVQVGRTSFRWAQPDGFAYPGYGRETDPGGSPSLIAAYWETGEPQYLAGLIRSAGYGLGINPTGHVMTSGLGTRPVRFPFMIDPKLSAQSAPPGITVYGALSPRTPEIDGPWLKLAQPFVYPAYAQWPTREVFFDSHWTIMMNEFTVDHPMAGVAWTWGHLAFRDRMAGR